MKRKIVKIDESKCNGCGACVPNCAEGALQIIDGKARLVGELYCDGLGACLGTCPQGAITIEERDAAAFDEAAVERHMAEKRGGAPAPAPAPGGGCPGMALQSFGRSAGAPRAAADEPPPSRLGQWPVQLMLVPPHAPFLRGAELVICADCVPFAVADFHERYLDGRAVLVGCPKLDDLEFYRRKLAEIFAAARPRRVTVLRMEVPCCAGIANAAVAARNAAAPDTPLEVHVIGIRGGVERFAVEAAGATAG